MRKDFIKVVIFIVITFSAIWGMTKWTQSFWDKVDVRTRGELILPSPSDIQTWLNILEPENAIEIDGRIGPAIMAKWERVYCNQQAEKTFEGK